MRRTSTAILGLTLGGFVTFAGCSSDSDDDPTPPATAGTTSTAGTDASGGTAGSAGTTSTAGTGGSAGGAVDGCTSPDQCDSKLCGADGNCTRCIGDNECAGDNLCGSGTCRAACTADPDCGGGGLTCCTTTGHCANLAADIRNCGACGTACTETQFCSSGAASACVDVSFANLCQNASAVVIKDGQTEDDAAADLIKAALAKCSPAITAEEVQQNSGSAVIDLTTGRAITGPGKLVVATGGDFFQKYAKYAKESRAGYVWDDVQDKSYNIYRKEGVSQVLLATYTIDTDIVENAKDIIVIQLVRDATNGTLGLVIYGGYGSGTRAGAIYVSEVMMANLAAFTNPWYVIQWNDSNTAVAGPDAADTFTQVHPAP